MASNESDSVVNPLAVLSRMESRSLLPDRPILIEADADSEPAFAFWRSRLGGYLLLFGILVAISIASLALFQRSRRKYEARERENAERLRMAYEAAEVGVWEYEVDTKRMTWEPTMYRLHGLSEKNYQDSTAAWRTSLVSEDVPQAERFLQEVMQDNRTLSVILRSRTETGRS